MKTKKARWTWLDTMEVIFYLELVACFVRERHGLRGVRQLFARLRPEVAR